MIHSCRNEDLARYDLLAPHSLPDQRQHPGQHARRMPSARRRTATPRWFAEPCTKCKPLRIGYWLTAHSRSPAISASTPCRRRDPRPLPRSHLWLGRFTATTACAGAAIGRRRRECLSSMFRRQNAGVGSREPHVHRSALGARRLSSGMFPAGSQFMVDLIKKTIALVRCGCVGLC